METEPLRGSRTTWWFFDLHRARGRPGFFEDDDDEEEDEDEAEDEAEDEEEDLGLLMFVPRRMRMIAA